MVALGTDLKLEQVFPRVGTAATRDEVSTNTWGPSSRTSPHSPPHHATLCSPCWQCPTSRKVGRAQWSQTAWAKERVLPSSQCTGPWVSVCLPQTMASWVLWTGQQDMELGLLETELGPKAA